MDTQTLILLVMMAAGTIYVTIGCLYRVFRQGETFSLEKIVTTFGYVALMSVAAYITTGGIPNFDLILTQAMAGLPDPATTMTLIMTIVTWIVHNVVKSTSTTSVRTGLVPAIIAQPTPSLSPVPGSTARAVAPTVDTAQLPANWIARPVGIFKAGPNGVSGDFEPLGTDPAVTAIRHDMFARMNPIYGLEINRDSPASLRMESIIIDIEYDGYVEHDPHLSRPTEFLTDYPSGLGKGLMFGYFQVPNNRYEYSANKIHAMTIRTAPRPKPTADGTVGPRDFSAAAGGVSATFQFLIYPTSQPLILSPMQQDT
jgi:hypothetical protein